MKKRKYLFLSLFRRKWNLFIFLVLVGLSVLILSAITIYQSADKTITDISESYSSSFALDRVRDESNPAFWEDFVIEEIGYSYRAYVGPNVNFEMLDRIVSEVEGVTEYEAGSDNWEVLLTTYKLVPGFWDETYKDILKRPEEYPKQGIYPGGLEYAEYLKNNLYATTADSVCRSNHYEQFVKGYFVLKEGRHIVPEDTKAVMISTTLAEKNGLKVGNTLNIEQGSTLLEPFKPLRPLAKRELEIVGLFEMTYQPVISRYTVERDILENRLIVDKETGIWLSEVNGNAKPTNVGWGQLYVESPKELKKVMEEVQALDWIDWKYYKLTMDNSEYSNVTNPLENMKTILLLGGYVIVILGMVLISILMVHSVKKRTREMGITMALGISVKEIKHHIQKEYLILSGAAFGVSLILCIVVAPTMGNVMFQGLGADNTPKEYTQAEMEAAIARGDTAAAFEMGQDQIQMQEGIRLDGLKVEISPWMVCIIAGAELLVVWFFVDNALDKTLRQEPMGMLSMIR